MSRDDFDTLVHRYADGLATADEVAALNARLRGDANARRQFAERLNLDSALGALAAGGATLEPSQSAARSRRFRIALAACAASVVVAVAVLALRPGSKPVTSEPSFAQVSGAVDVDWSSDADVRQVGDRLGTQRLNLKSGRVQVATDNGVSLELNGPAEAEFVEAMRLRVHSGRVTAEVGPEAKGFTIETQYARVVDLGTKFGIDASDSAHTDVVVIRGEVRVYEKAGNAAPVASLTTGQGLRMDRSRRAFRIESVTADSIGDGWTTHGLAGGSIITAVRDNLVGGHPSLKNFYRIVPGGFREDAPAYADSGHQWNGLDEKGLPASLIGSDMVQTLNVDNYNWWMQITVTLSRPCVLYVLADRRNPTPAWLAEHFTDTGVNVGWEFVRPQDGIAAQVGPGRGRKLFPFGVWKLEVPQPGEVTLGPPYFAKIEGPKDVRPNWMYGIVAKPLPALNP